MVNIFDHAMPERGKENIEELLNKKNVVINRIVSNDVQNGEWYDQSEDEWFVLLAGEAVVEFEDKEKALSKGDTFFIPAHLKHRVKSTSQKALWLTVHIL
ncbi:cupin domain-containing protein [Sulfurimonas sp. HSL3-7]|uniref:cupin domain-containing protein n=1 Tax=Sulfonitrofixus jiaomeiensis TaxID=3131938 RepID=UPI0031F94DA6